MRIGILGASGQLGGKTLDALLARGVSPADIAAMARTPAKLDVYASQGIDVRQADYDDVASMEAAFEGVDNLLLVPSIALPAPRAMQYANAIAAAQTANVSHLLHYGLVGTDIESPFAIAPFLLFAESAIRQSGLQWTILRNSLYADPIAAWTDQIVAMGTIPYPTGDGRCSFVSRDDIARAGAAALAGAGEPNRAYSLTGPMAHTTGELCEIVARVTGKPVARTDASEQDYVDRCRAEGEPEIMISILASLYAAVREGFYDVVTDDIEQLTGQPAESFESYLRRTYRPGSAG